MADLPTPAPILPKDAPHSHDGSAGKSAYTGKMSDSDRNSGSKTSETAALVGWNTMHMGERLVLQLQSVTTPPPHKAGDVTSHYFVITQNQAVQLGNYLFQMTGQTAPRKHKRGVLDKLLGG